MFISSIYNLNHLMQSTDLPLLTAFVLGLLTALNPCQLAISVSALAYEYKRGKRIVDGILYAAGRTVTYTVLGWIMMCLIGGGRNIEGFQALVSKAEVIIPYILFIIGLYLIVRAFHHHHHDGDNCHNSGTLIRRNGPLGSLILGMILALAFCPESAIFYFGIMLPLAVKTSASIFIPLVFSVAAALPVLTIAFIMRKAVDGVHKISHSFEVFQSILNAVTGVLFIIIAILLLME